jgi:hypothetical protein
MKKRILLVTLTLVLLLMTIVPTAALAKNDRCGQSARPTDFTGAGQIWVTYMPDPVIHGNIWRYQSELVEGVLTQCDWDLLADTAFWSEHSSTVRVDEQYNACGMMRGSFSLTRPDGSGVLTGVFTGRIQGNLYSGDIYDQGTWHAIGGSGVFEGVRAWGRWSAELHYGEVGGQATLVGPSSWSGKYQLGKNHQPQVNEITQEVKHKIKERIGEHVKENNRDKIRDSLEKWRKTQ